MAEILLIDDNHNFAFGLAGNLHRAGFSVKVVSDGAEGVKLASKMSPG
jgi:DNA-binding response OmpR family regulator